jgi:hypothetical protein
VGEKGRLLISVLYWAVSLNHSLLQHVQRDFGVGSRGSFPRFSATNTSGVRCSRPAVGVTLQRSCRHVRLVASHIFTSFQLNQQLNIHANITHVRKQIRLTSQTRRNSHCREVNCTRTTPKSDYYALFVTSVRIQEISRRSSIPMSTCSKHTQNKLQNIFRLGTYRRTSLIFWPCWPYKILNSHRDHNELINFLKKNLI